MNWEFLWKAIPTVCEAFRWLTKRKPTRGLALIVEDNEHDAKNLQRILRKRGWDSEVATSGEVAIGAVKHQFYPLCFVDLRLPGLSGEALLRILSEDAPNTFLCVVCGEPADLTNLPPGMFVSIIRKPAELESIEGMLQKLKFT